MAEKRMFAKKIIDSDLFLDMPLTSQALYFHLSMRADDDGFIDSPKKIQRSIGATDDDFKVLTTKQFIIPFESGVIVIKHWLIHNTLKKDRYKPTLYVSEKDKLKLFENKEYLLENDDCFQNGSRMETQYRLDKNRVDKSSIVMGDKSPEETTTTRKQFKAPTAEEVKAYCSERNNNVDSEKFVNYYTANGWHVGKHRMKDWKAAVRTWETNSTHSTAHNNKFNNFSQEHTEYDEFERRAMEKLVERHSNQK